MASDLTITISALKKIGVVSADGTPDNDDVRDSLQILKSRVDALRELSVVWWSDDETPLFMEDALAEYLTAYFAPLFMTEQEALAYASRSERGLVDMRRMASKEAQGAPVRAVYY